MVSSSASVRSVRTRASNASHERAARPVPPYTTSSSGRSATSGSRLFISIRSAASWPQPRQDSSPPRGAWTVRALTRGPRSRPRPRRARPPRPRAPPPPPAPGPASGPAPGRGRPRAPRPARRRCRAPGSSGARRSSARAAHVSSTARMRPRFATTVRSLRAPPQPIDTWSSCIALVGSESVLGGHGEAAVLGHHRRLRVVGEHQPGVHARVLGQERRQAVRASRVEHAVGAALRDRADLGGRDRQEVAGQRHRRAVKVPARLHAAVGQHHRVVDGRAQLGGGHGLHVGPRVPRGAVHLRRAAHRVGVLHARIVVAVARHDLGAGEQPREVGGAACLAGLRAHGHEVRGEGAIGAEQRLGGHRRRHVRRLQQPRQVVEGQQQHPEDAVRAVDQGEALLRRSG